MSTAFDRAIGLTLSDDLVIGFGTKVLAIKRIDTVDLFTKDNIISIQLHHPENDVKNMVELAIVLIGGESVKYIFKPRKNIYDAANAIAGWLET